MSVTKIRLGTKDDGTPLFHYVQDDPTKSVVFTGPVTGAVELPDGTVYDVSDELIEVEPGHELLVGDAIGDRHVADGHPELVADPERDSFGFVHVRSDGTAVISGLAAEDTIAEAQVVHGDALTVTEV
jgi:hypothetical protein